MTKRKQARPVPPGAMFISAGQLRDRWGGLSLMTIARRLETDPDFPKPHYFGRLRFWKIADIEAYERRAAVEKKKTA
jgi:predicted DNA-binding transcriptional regulator AlpA